MVILCESMLWHLEFEPSKLNQKRSPQNMQIGRHGFQIIGYTETDLASKYVDVRLQLPKHTTYFTLIAGTSDVQFHV
jgi:hypothetical protein